VIEDNTQTPMLSIKILFFPDQTTLKMRIVVVVDVDAETPLAMQTSSFPPNAKKI
jgi:hypothetical protein